MATVYRNRDPYARQEVVAETIPAQKSTCSWCGSSPPWQGRNAGKLRQYRTETDTGHVYYQTGLFCSHSCFVTYRS